MDADKVQLDDRTILSMAIVDGRVIGTIRNSDSGSEIVLEKGGLTVLMQSFGLLSRKCEEALAPGAVPQSQNNGARGGAGVYPILISDDEVDDETTPRLPGLRYLRRVLDFSSSSSEVESDDDDVGIFMTQSRFMSDSENDIPYEDEFAQHWFTDGEDSSDDDVEIIDINAQADNRHAESETEAIDWDSDFSGEGGNDGNEIGLTNLPSELIAKIALNLCSKDLLNFKASCSRMNFATENNAFWVNKIEADFSASFKIDNKDNAKTVYKMLTECFVNGEFSL